MKLGNERREQASNKVDKCWCELIEAVGVWLWGLLVEDSLG